MLPTAGSRGEPAKAITLPPPPLLIMDIFTKQIWAADLYSQLKTVFEVSPEKIIWPDNTDSSGLCDSEK